jgi:hypothetical protein
MKKLEKTIKLRGVNASLIQIKRTEKVAMYQNSSTNTYEVFRIQNIRANHIEWELYPLQDHFGTTAFEVDNLTQADDLYKRLNELS